MKPVLVSALLLSSPLAFAQQPTTLPADTTKKPATSIVISDKANQAPGLKPVAEKNELKYNLNESGTHFFKATFLNQTWLQFNQSNPGSTVVGEPKDNTLSIGLRRTRMQLLGRSATTSFCTFSLE